MARAIDVRGQPAVEGVSRRVAWRSLSLVQSPRIKRYTPYAVIIAAIAIVYHWWLSGGVVTGGDWGYGADAHLRDFWPIPSLWDGAAGTGAANILAAPAFPLYALHGLLAELGIGYAVDERLFWLFPCLLAGALATYALAVALYANRLAGIVAAFFVAFNYYTMGIFAGGQFTVIDAGLLMPVILWLFYRALLRPTASRLAPTALAVGVQVMYDPRSTYLTVWMLLLLALYYVIAQSSVATALRAGLRVALQFAVIGVIVVLMHLFWLLPGHYAEKIALPAGYGAVGGVSALSYFHFDEGFALYQPPPPSTTVGALFLLLPILAFGTLLRRRVTSVDMFLVSMALLAIFFTKGDNPPAGAIYDWLFVHFPGFDIYRDPSKFFQPLLLADALLLGRMAAILAARRSDRPLRNPVAARGRVRTIAPLLCFAAVAVSAAPIASRGSYATFAPVTVPDEYRALEHYMEQQQHFSRTLWVFGQALYVGNTDLHPAISADTVAQQLQPFAQIRDSTPSWLLLPRAKAILQGLSVEYVAVGDNLNPGDSARTTARNRVMQAQRIALVRRAFPRFAEIRIGHIYLFRNPSYLPELFVARAALSGTQARALLQRATAPLDAGARRIGTPGELPIACRACLVDASYGRTRFEAVVHHATRPFLLVLNQSFDPNWVVYIEPSGAPRPFWWTWTHPAVPPRYHTTVNGFANAWWIDAPGTYRIVVDYWPQRLTDVGFILSWLTILVCLTITITPALARIRRRRARTPDVPLIARPRLSGDGAVARFRLRSTATRRRGP